MASRNSKSELRRRAQRIRAGLRAQRDEVSARIARALLPELLARRPANVAAYRALADEVDPAPIAAALAGAGIGIALPAVERRAAPLVFRRYRPGDPLRRSAFGIEEPFPDAPQVHPDVLLVPLLAFDREGYRLGFGGGYYDRTIADLRRAGKLFAVGLAFAAQEMPALPREPHDMRLDLIASEDGLVWPQGKVPGAGCTGVP